MKHITTHKHLIISTTIPRVMPPSSRDIFWTSSTGGGANTSSPIFFYAGEEADILGDVLYVNFIADLAARFKGLLLYVEVCLPSRVHEYLINLEMDEKKLHFAASLLWRIISIWIQQRNIPKWEYTWILELRTGFGRLCTGHYRC